MSFQLQPVEKEKVGDTAVAHANGFSHNHKEHAADRYAILQLQSRYGNRGLRRLFKSGVLLKSVASVGKTSFFSNQQPVIQKMKGYAWIPGGYNTRYQQEQEQEKAEKHSSESSGGAFGGMYTGNVINEPRRRMPPTPVYKTSGPVSYSGKVAVPQTLQNQYGQSLPAETSNWPPLVDFTPVAMVTVVITYQGSRKKDYVEAERITGKTHTPYVTAWHHVADFNQTTGKGTLQLVPYDIHNAIKHKGGVEQANHFVYKGIYK